MEATIRKWGNSQGVRIPKQILDTVNWKENEKINIRVEEGRIIMEKVNNRKNIKELFESFDEEYEPVKIDWGRPIGDEIW